MDTEKNIQQIPIEDIIPNRFQPRLTFNEEGLNELSESIKQHGIIQPLVVRKLGDKYEIIAGERRYKAATQAGLTKVPVIISDLDDNKSAEVALVENIQRRNLTSIEEAKSYKNLLDRGYLTQEQLAAKMGVSQSAIANKLRLLNLDPEVQDALLNEKISERHARALLTLDNSEDQKKWLNRIINERMTVRQLDMELKKLKEDNEDDGGIPLVNINPNIDDILNNAEDINSVRQVHDVRSMMIPDEIVKTQEQKTTPLTNNQPSPKQNSNKFFNFLEDEQVNMDVGDPEEIFNNFVPANPTIVEQKEDVTPKNMNNVEILDDLDSMNNVQSNKTDLEITQPQEVPESNVINEEISSPESSENFEPFKPVFFSQLEQKEDKPEPDVPNDVSNNIIEEYKPINEEVIVDPMDSVIKLDPLYEEKQEEIAGTDLKSAINKIRDTVEELNKKGFEIDTEEADLEDLYHITIKIPKK